MKSLSPCTKDAVLRRLACGTILSAFLLAVGTATAQEAKEPGAPVVLSETRFNDTKGVTLKDGAKLGPSGSGASGRLGDRALSIDRSASPGGHAIPAGPSVSEAGYNELTVTAWFKARDGELDDAETLWNAFGSHMLWDPNIQEWRWRLGVKSPSTESPMVGWYGVGKNPPPIAPGEWVFIAATWDRLSASAEFFMGSVKAEAKSTRKGEKEVLLSSAKEGKAGRMIGNDGGKLERAFDGEIDNVRFYDHILDAAAIEKIRAADAANEPVHLP